jgi:hypothetical protein
MHRTAVLRFSIARDRLFLLGQTEWVPTKRHVQKWMSKAQDCDS